jgi:hypothetical protein
MTDEKVIELYEKANGWSVEGWDKTIKELKQFAALVEAEERKACVKLLEDFSQTRMVPVVDTWRMGLVAGANAIRGARGRNE